MGNWRSQCRNIGQLMEHRSRNGSAFGMSLTDGRYTQCLLKMLTKWSRKTYMTRVEGENTRLRHYLARVTPKDIVLLQVC